MCIPRLRLCVRKVYCVRTVRAARFSLASLFYLGCLLCYCKSSLHRFRIVLVPLVNSTRFPSLKMSSTSPSVRPKVVFLPPPSIGLCAQLFIWIVCFPEFGTKVFPARNDEERSERSKLEPLWRPRGFAPPGPCGKHVLFFHSPLFLLFFRFPSTRCNFRGASNPRALTSPVTFTLTKTTIT